MARGKPEIEERADPAAIAIRTLFRGLLEAARCLRRGKLQRAHAALRKVAGALPPQQLDGQWWAREVRDLCYDMEDALDDIACLPPPPNKLSFRDRVMTFVFSTKKKRKMEIEMASGGVTEGFLGRVKSLLDKYRWADDSINQLIRITAGPRVDPRLPPVYRGIDSRDLVGMDHARDELIRLVLTPPQGGGGGGQPATRRKTVVSVLGSAGLGKTTLAKAAYDRLQAQFDCRAFVRVGPDPIVEHVLVSILRALDGGGKYDILVWKTVEREELVREIRHFLRDKSYLLVVDDVWYPQEWEEIDRALPDDGRGSRVITTTRHARVAAQAGGKVYRPEPMSDVDARRLFFKRVFGGEGRCPDGNRLAEVTGAMILKKCGGGSPLAVISMASVVAMSGPQGQWSAALGYSMDSVQEASWPYRDNMCVERLRRALSLSYYDLPCLLRLCMLHLSAFPKGYLVEKDTLIWRWVAEGFVHHDHHQAAGRSSLYEIGESYFNELVNRGMIQASNTQQHGYYCRVHPMMLSLVRYFSRQENFVTVLDSDRRHSCAYARRDMRCDCCLAPRLAMHAARDMTDIEAALGYRRLDKARVRCLDGRRLCCVVDDMPQLLGSFHGLRLLALEHCRGGAVGSAHLQLIGKLRHLRYLGLLGTRVVIADDAAGEAVGGLRLLQTLDLRGTDVEALPPAVFELGQLICLCVDGDSVGVEQWREMRKLASLEEVRLRLRCGNGDCSRSLEHLAAVLDGLVELRVLEISGLDPADGETHIV